MSGIKDPPNQIRVQRTKITTTDEYMPANFFVAVKMLARPYIKITGADVERIEALTRDCGDIVICKGKRMTYGTADGGFALMPLSERQVDEYGRRFKLKANELTKYAAKECSRIIGWFGSYSDASETAAEKGYKKFSIQHSGQGWQDHKWCLIHYFKGV